MVASFQVLSKSNERSKRSRKYPSQSEARAAFFADEFGAKAQTWKVQDVEYLLLVKFRQIPFGYCRLHVDNVPARGQGGHLSRRINLKTQSWQRTLLPVKITSNFVKWSLEES